MKKNVLYSVANYAEIVRDNGYFVDKTDYIKKLERVKNPVFLRPRRFGKSLLCSIQQYYYDLIYADQFEALFGHTWIGQNPTGNQNQFIVLSLNFSVIEPSAKIQQIEQNFKKHCNFALHSLRDRYKDILSDMPEIELDATVANNLTVLLRFLKDNNLPSIYLIIDEYDNFANQLVLSHPLYVR